MSLLLWKQLYLSQRTKLGNIKTKCHILLIEKRPISYMFYFIQHKNKPTIFYQLCFLHFIGKMNKWMLPKQQPCLNLVLLTVPDISDAKQAANFTLPGPSETINEILSLLPPKKIL